MTSPDVVAALGPFLTVLQRMGVTYYLGGSLASSAYGLPRSSLDADIIADLRAEHVPQLVESLQADYYLSPSAMHAAIAEKSCFNAIHLETMFKIDVFAVKRRRYDRIELGRIRKGMLDAEDPRTEFLFPSPEDIVLNKLEWFRLGDEVSERQWNDVLGVLKVQAGALDSEYLDQWATELGVSDLLEKARKAALGGG